MRRATALLMLSGVILFAAKAALAAGGSALKWTAVELSMIPRSDDVAPVVEGAAAGGWCGYL